MKFASRSAVANFLKVLILVAAAVSIGAIVNSTSCSAEESLDAFLDRYKKAIVPVRALYRFSSYEGRREIYIPGESENPARPKAFRVFAKGDRMRLDLGYPEGKNLPGSGNIAYTCRVSHPEKSFAVQQHFETGKYFLLDIHADAIGAASTLRSLEFAVDAPYSVRGLAVEEFLKLSYVKVGSIVEQPDNKVRVEFSIDLDPGQVAAKNWLVLDAAHQMALMEYCVGNFPVTSRVEFKYGDLGGTMPVVVEMNSYEHWVRDAPGSPLELTQTNHVDNFDFRAPPDKVFTLAAFGIHERTGFQIRWYVWLFIASVVVLAIRGWFSWRSSKEDSGR